MAPSATAGPFRRLAPPPTRRGGGIETARTPRVVPEEETEIRGSSVIIIIPKRMEGTMFRATSGFGKLGASPLVCGPFRCRRRERRVGGHVAAVVVLVVLVLVLVSGSNGDRRRRCRWR